MNQANFTLPKTTSAGTPTRTHNVNPTPQKAPPQAMTAQGPLAPPSLSGKRELEPGYEALPEPTPNKGMLIGVAACGVALLMFGLGMIWRGGGNPAAAQPAPPVENFFTEQQKLMREAVDMAREAQQKQREKMQMMRQQIQAAEEGPMTFQEPRRD